MSFTKYRIYDDYRGTVESTDSYEEALKMAKEYSLRHDREVYIYRAEVVVKAAMPTGIEIPAIVMDV